MLARRGKKAGIVIETLLILIGLGLLVKGALVGTDVFEFTHTARPVGGTISSIADHGFGAYVHITPSTDEGYVFFQRGLFFNNHAGDRVSALYDPKNPRKGHVNKFNALWFDTLMLSISGFLLLVIGLRLRSARSV